MIRKYLIEREIPGAGALTPEQLAGAAHKSNCALSAVGPGIQWLHSYVTDDRIVCVYLAEDEALIARHAEASGFPATRVVEVHSVIDPATEQRWRAAAAA